MAYNGTVELIAGITPKNNGTFPLVNAKDVYVTDSLRLDSALEALKGFDYTICSTNATTPNIITNGTLAPSTDTMYRIYLVPTSSNSGNIYSEYITIQNGSTYTWEKIGTTDMDLSNYVTKTDLSGIDVSAPLTKTVQNGILTAIGLSTPGDATKFLCGDGTWQIVSGGGSVDLTDYPTKSDIKNISLRANVLSSGSNPFSISEIVGSDNLPTQISFTLSQMKGATENAAGMAGLVPAPSKTAYASTRFLSADGTWRTPISSVSASGTAPVSASFSSVSAGHYSLQVSVSTMTGATASAAGLRGVVPAPAAGDQDKFLRGDGTWQEVAAGGSNSNIICKQVHITIPAQSLQYVYDDTTGWVDSNTICFSHNMVLNSNINMSIRWTFTDSHTIVFDFGAIPQTALEFDFCMCKIVSEP